MQLLWINLVTDSLPAVALGVEPIENDIMDKKPKPKSEGLFANGFGIRTVLQGFMFGILTLAAFYIGERSMQSIEAGRTMAFIVLSLSQVVQSFNLRSDRSIFKIGAFTNPQLNKAVLVSLVLILLVVFTPLSIMFELVALSFNLYLIAFGLSIVPLFVMEISKLCGLIKSS